ncbi:MAG TPA: oxalate/formate MFS antiporter [Kofleriaceae bacterium]|jgi:OFA family oxalate/formate antiporter-like MFS transporter|nr:oxalate/formate MFS antiporter [Kofleriaceae bacterium]
MSKNEESASSTKNEKSSSSSANEEPASVEAARARLNAGRWRQLIFGVICMVMIANLQYSWTLFATPIAEKYHWKLELVQTAFTIFVLLETWLVPIEGWLADRLGPRRVVVGGGVLAGLGWVLSAYADSLPMLYVAYGIAGVGAGAVYGTCVGNALKWFPERRGLAAGITAAGFGAGAAATVLPLGRMIETSGYEATFLWFGIGQGAVIMIIGMLLAAPDANAVAALPKPPAMRTNRPQFTWRQMIRTPVFWVMYVMFVLMGAGGLFITANLKQIAVDFKVADAHVSFLGLTLKAILFALFLDKIMNGLTRPFFGWVSDRIGRENTMFIAFGIEAIGILALSQLGADPVLFVVLSGLVFFAWGEIYSLFPATCTDTFGWKYATTNSGALYTAKGTAALFVPLAVLLSKWASWHTVFMVAAAANGLAAVMALVVLKPMRQRMLARETSSVDEAAADRVADAGMPAAVAHSK